jgi:hypothetical protein
MLRFGRWFYLLGRWRGLWEMWETRQRFPSPVGRRGLIAAFHRTAASIARFLLLSP